MPFLMPILTWFIGPIGRYVAIAGICFLFGFWKGWSMGHAGKEAAVAARDIEWQAKINAANEEAEKRIKAAEEAANALRATPVDRTELVRLCNTDAYCRDRAK